MIFKTATESMIVSAVYENVTDLDLATHSYVAIY